MRCWCAQGMGVTCHQSLRKRLCGGHAGCGHGQCSVHARNVGTYHGPQGLEEASRLYFGENNVEGMLATLLPLHAMVEQSGASTLKEIGFVQSYGRCVCACKRVCLWVVHVCVCFGGKGLVGSDGPAVLQLS